MAWIIVSANGEELDRRELTAAPVVLGRSPECDVAIRDILLSRTHCRIEPAGHDWRVVDLKSKNGTRVGWQQVTSQVLRDGDHLRMGRTRIVFYTGAFEPAPERKPRTDRIVRPADPHEALSGTVTDFVLIEEHLPQDEIEHRGGELPIPQPRPHDEANAEGATAAETRSDDLASSFWYREGDASAGTSTANAVAPMRTVARALPRVPAKAMNRLPRRAASGETDLSLQVDHEPAPVLEAPPYFRAAPQPPSRRRRLAITIALTLLAAVGTGIVVMSLWLLTLAPR
jgi:pSer/pThr/pTyr-binding forkhead associated (FHA) protein